jgi:hypothetical protein
MPMDRPWVPLRILGLGLPADEVVQADVFLLTDDKPELLAGGDGLSVERREPASDLLLDDLRSDVAWLTHLVLTEEAGALDYDLSAGTATAPASAIDAGLELADTDRPIAAVDPAADGDDVPVGGIAAVAVGMAAIVGAGAAWMRTRDAS